MTPRPPTPRSAETEALRIVFFGSPRSGKTSLLEAFERIASNEAESAPVPLKHAHSADPVRRELIPQIVLVDLPDADLVARAVLLLDCDGEASGKLLNQPGELARSRARGELASAIRDADCLVLIVEAKSAEREIESHFQSFQSFLDALRSGRTFDREVGGWPIYLTLTKCDKLHEPGMPVEVWLNRVEAELEDLEARFVERFDGDIQSPGDAFSFGSLRLATEATATSLPVELRDPAYDLTDGTHNLDTFVPGVLAAAAEYRSRARAARRRLKWTATGVVALFALMVALMLGLFAVGEASPLEKLTGRVAALQTMNEPAASRLADENLARRKNELEQIHRSAEFASLPPGQQQFVETRLREVDEYSAYRREFASPQFSPADVRTLTSFQNLQRDLETKLSPPAEYAEAWSGTEAVRLRAKWRDDLRLLGESEDRVHTWYRRLIAEAIDLVVHAQQPDWRRQIGRLVRDAEHPPFLPAGVPAADWPTQPVPGSQRLPIPRGEPLTFESVLRYERADFAKRDWEVAERRLLDLLDLTDAIGLTVNPDLKLPFGEPAAILNLPEPNADAAASKSLASKRLAMLKRRYPRAAEGTAYWQTGTYPEPLGPELSRRLRLAHETGVRHVRNLIEAELALDNDRADTRADWRRLIDPTTGLLLQPELRDWGRLLQLLQSWSDPSRGEADPVAELTAFLKADQFPIPLSAVEIYLPNSLRVQVLTPDGGLQLSVGPPDAPIRRVTLQASADVRTDANGSTYRFVPAIPLTPLDYRPGDGFAAELPLKSGRAEFVLRWPRQRTATYAIEKLLLDPDLEGVKPAEKPQRASGIRVKILPEEAGGFVPELLPALRGIN